MSRALLLLLPLSGIRFLLILTLLTPPSIQAWAQTLGIHFDTVADPCSPQVLRYPFTFNLETPKCPQLTAPTVKICIYLLSWGKRAHIHATVHSSEDNLKELLFPFTMCVLDQTQVTGL